MYDYTQKSSPAEDETMNETWVNCSKDYKIFCYPILCMLLESC